MSEDSIFKVTYPRRNGKDDKFVGAYIPRKLHHKITLLSVDNNCTVGELLRRFIDTEIDASDIDGVIERLTRKAQMAWDFECIDYAEEKRPWHFNRFKKKIAGDLAKRKVNPMYISKICKNIKI